MTEAQQRKLFRMLAEKGMHEDKARDELKRRFRVNDLGDVSEARGEPDDRAIAHQEAKGGR
jgi:hypothetical protein